jgi:hypothetical protein
MYIYDLREWTDLSAKDGANGAVSGPVGPNPRPASLRGGPFDFPFNVDFPPPLRINLHHV